MNPTVPENIVIVGGGSAGWMAASVLLQSLGRQGCRITLIESSRIATIGVGEGTIPLFRRFLHYLQIPEPVFMSACQATYKHGINFPGWTSNEEFSSYFHPFNTPDFTRHDERFFHNCNLRRNGQAVNTVPEDFFFNAEMAKQRKSPAGPPPCDPNRVGYAYHFDAGLLADFLKQRALDRGIVHLVDDVTDVIRNGNGDISHLVTAGNGEIHADFFIDCTGFARKLIGETLGTEIISYKPRLFNDSAVVMRTALAVDAEVPPFTESRALKYGWAWRIPLVSRIGWGYVYSSDYTTREDAERELRNLIGAEANELPARHLKMQVGRITEHWKNNCVAIGLSQGFIEPLEATALGLTQFSINRFIANYIEGGFQSDRSDIYNRTINDAFDSTLDYIQMHYVLNTRDDTRYWRDCRANDNISDTMRRVIEGWDRSDIDFSTVLNETVSGSYSPYSWYCILSGMGRYSEATLGKTIKRQSNPYQDIVTRYYGHRQYLNSIHQT